MCSKNEMDAALWITKSTSSQMRRLSAADRPRSASCRSPGMTTIFSLTSSGTRPSFQCRWNSGFLCSSQSMRSSPAGSPCMHALSCCRPLGLRVRGVWPVAGAPASSGMQPGAIVLIRYSTFGYNISWCGADWPASKTN